MKRLTQYSASIRSWLAGRYDIGAAEAFAEEQAHKPLPTHVGFWHTFGSLSLFLFLNQVVTGILLMISIGPPWIRPLRVCASSSPRRISAG